MNSRLLLLLSVLVSLVSGQNTFSALSKWLYSVTDSAFIPSSLSVPALLNRVYISGYYSYPTNKVANVIIDNTGALFAAATGDLLPNNVNVTATFNVGNRQFSVGRYSSATQPNITARSITGSSPLVYDTTSVNINRETFGAVAGDAAGNFVMMNLRNISGTSAIWITYYSGVSTPLWRSFAAGPSGITAKIAHCSVMHPTNSSITYHAVTSGTTTTVYRFDFQNVVASMTFSGVVTPTAILVDDSRGKVFVVGVSTATNFEGFTNNANRTKFTFVTVTSLSLVNKTSAIINTPGFDTYPAGAQLEPLSGDAIIFGSTFGTLPGFSKSGSANVSHSDVFLARVDSTGVVTGLTQSSGPKNDVAIDVSVDTTNIYLLLNTFGGIYNITSGSTAANYVVALNLGYVAPSTATLLNTTATPTPSVNGSSSFNGSVIFTTPIQTALANGTSSSTATSTSSSTSSSDSGSFPTATLASLTPATTSDPFTTFVNNNLIVVLVVAGVVCMALGMVIVYFIMGNSGSDDDAKKSSSRMMAPLATFNGNGTNYGGQRDAPTVQMMHPGQTIVSPSGTSFRKYDEDPSDMYSNPNHNDVNRANTMADYNARNRAQASQDGDAVPYEDFDGPTSDENFAAYPAEGGGGGVDELDAIAATLNAAFE